MRLFEIYVSPKFGWLLGLAKQPDYFKRAKVTDDGQLPRVQPGDPVLSDQP